MVYDELQDPDFGQAYTDCIGVKQVDDHSTLSKPETAMYQYTTRTNCQNGLQ